MLKSGPDQPATALVVDDHTFMRQAMRSCLEAVGVSRCDEAGSVAEAVSCLREAVPVITVLDLNLPDGSALELIPRVRAAGCERVVVFTSADDSYTVRASYEAGACAYLLKTASPETIMDGLRAALTGEIYADARVASLLAQGVRNAPLADVTSLTRRELQVLGHVAQGRTNAEIADALGTSALSVKSHLTRIGRKLGSGDRTEMVTIAMRAGLLR